ncbi:MAG: XRE family transcriptional regulator [Actinomycetota bacterium]|jgi:transcriptional regulator with XRE-family HTH domain|nr:XRE family transcriptional regulator [Actinomycetota bacterium]
MSTSRRHPANRRLAWERLERGWSHEELCQQLTRSMRETDEPDTGLTANTVRRWEIGDRWPEPRFRKHLVLVFGMTASQLGLLTADEMAARPSVSPSLDLVERLLAMVNDESFEAGVGRQVLLRGVLAAGMLPALSLLAASTSLVEPVAWSVRRGGQADVRAVDSYATITARHRELYWTAPALALLRASLGHTQLGIELLGHGAGQHATLLAGSVAESALLGARLAFFDLQQVPLALGCFETASTAVTEANDHALAAAILAHRSFVPGFAGDRAAATPLLDAARAHARYAGGPVLRSWLHCVHAEVSARTGEVERSVHHARQAEDALSTSGEDPEWLDFFDPARLASFLGYSQLIAGRTADAQASLQQALEQLDERAGKQRTVVLLDLATTHAAADPAHAMTLAGQALDLLEHEPYGAAYGRIPEVRQALDGTPQAQILDERVRALPTAMS